MARILHVYRTYFPDTQGGLEETIRQICRGTTSLGVENRICCLSRSPDPQILLREEAEVHRFPLSFEVASCGFSTSVLSGFRSLIAWADVVHYHFPWPFADLLHLLVSPVKPAIITYHSDIIRQKSLLFLYRPLMRYFLRQADCIVTTSKNYLVTSNILNQFRDKVEIIPIGLDRDSYPQLSDDRLAEVRDRMGVGFFLFVGVLRYYKGLHILLDAVRDTDLKVVIVGSGPVEQELKQRAAKMGLQNVCFLGHVSDEEKIALIKLAKAIVFPSYLRSEAFGVALLEGAMCGKPLISTEIGTGTSYVNRHGETGFVVPPADAAKFREAMQRLDRDADAVECMGRAACERYELLFTGKLMGEQYTRLYEGLIDRSG